MLALRAPAVRALAVRACAVRLRGKFVQNRAGRVVCLCSACLHRATLADTTPLVDPGDLTCPLPFTHSQSHSIALVMHCSSLFAPFLACVVPSFYSIFYCILCSVPCLRLCLRKVAQVSLSAAEHPGHLISHTFPPHFAPFVPALFSSCLAFFFTA